MSRALHETIDVPNPAFHTGALAPHARPYPYHSDLSLLFEIGDHHYYPGPPHSAQNQPSQGFSNFVDGSGHIFSMYLELATEEDKKMTENWKADADGILIFVRCYLLVNLRFMIHNDSTAVDWSIFRCCCIVDLCVDSGPSAKSTGYVQFLSRQHLSGYHQPKYTQCILFPPCLPSPILSTKLCCLGECTLVLKLGDQYYLCSTCNIATAVGAKIPQVHPVALQSP